MKLVLDKPVTVAQGLTLEEADWGPWQFPQLLKREDGVLFASINLGPDNWESYGDTLWYKSPTTVGRGRTAIRPKPPPLTRKPKTETALWRRTEATSTLTPSFSKGSNRNTFSISTNKPFFDYYLYSDLRPGTIDTSVMFMRLKKGETEQEGFCPKVTDNPGLCIVRPSERTSFFRTRCSDG